ncbi:acetamidase/formamidase family protein [Brachybacterium sp. YJGR34]|uniref:acetamidase/formamidase family protein n=1 Tax=Brachybacterium sp. YJGR34 TaxID=2059911 RepID=UPI000E0AB25D|nr:acetamidase/formamidase family protein [Brachybacterium sp. YJGR34]
MTTRSPLTDTFAAHAATLVERGVGRRGLLRATAALGAGAGLLSACTSSPAPADQPTSAAAPEILQPGTGEITGDHYLPSEPGDVLWGYVPTVHTTPVLQVASGETVTIDTVSHEGILEDQGRDPLAYFGEHGVEASAVLEDAVAVAAEYDRTPRDFALDGPHVVTGPIFVESAEPGDVLRIETLEATPRVPYGVVSSRHGKGSLAATADGAAPAGITIDQVMPPVATDARQDTDPTAWGNVSTFTSIEDGAGVMSFGAGAGEVRFPLRPFMGMMGVAHSTATDPTDPSAHSVPPTLGGGNIDIRLLGEGSTFYLPVQAEGALFYVGDPHHAMGDGEVALTAMEGSLRGTFRLTVCKAGAGDAPSLAHRYPFAETADAWIPIGLSDPDGSVDGQVGDLDVAMRTAVVNALDFLEQDRGMDRPTAYAYLSAAADFTISQVVDRTVGVHGVIPKAHFS